MDNILDMWEKAPNGEELAKALMKDADEKKKSAQPKSAMIDPYNAYGVGGTRSKQAVTPFAVLRNMAKVPAIAAILLTRKNQVSAHARRPRFDGDIGFKIGLKDTKAKMNDAQQKKAHEIEEFFLKTGAVKNRKRKDNFNTFLRKIVDDTLTLDVMTWENVPNLGGGLAEVWAVDGTTIEIVSSLPVGENHQPIVYEPMTKRGMKLGGDIAYVQRLNGQIEAEYSEEELAYAIRNPRTDIMLTDFGMSELEVLIEIVTGIMNGVRYNTTYFSHSHIPQGVLEVVGKYKDEHLEGFKRHWKNLTSGAAGKWSVPVMALSEGQGIKWTPFKNTNQDMQFNEFLEFLFNVACAVYQIDPNEVGFKSWTSNSGSMGQSDNTEEKMDKSKDKGLIPLMNFLSDTFNAEIVDQIDDDYAFYWVGLDEDDEDRRIERQEKEAQMGTKTVAMIWAENDVDIDEIKRQNGGELPKWANAPANATLIQVYMAETGLGQQAQPGEDPNAVADENQADREHENNRADDDHGKQMEIMDKQHQHAKEIKQLDQAHAANMETIKAKHAEKADDRKADHAEGADERKADMAEEADKRKGEMAESADERKGELAEGADERKGEAADKAAEQSKGDDDKPDPDDAHEKQLEVMDKQHELAMEQKKADQEHQTKIEKMKVQAKPKAVKKSLTDDEPGVMNITITWDNY